MWLYSEVSKQEKWRVKNTVNQEVKSQVRTLVEEILNEKKLEETKAKTEHTTPRKSILRHLLEEGSEPSESSASETDTPMINSYMNTSEDNKINVINFRLNQDLHEKVTQAAKQRGDQSEASFIREALLYRVLRASSDEKRKIDKLIQDSIEIKEGTRTFTFDGEKGFLTQATERKLTGEIWTLENLDKIVPYLKNTSYADKCIQALKLARAQVQYLKVSILATIDETQKENEYLLMPYAMCSSSQCLRPLTKKRIS